MAELDTLREGEDQARQVLENAGKDARRITQSIPAMIEEMKRKEDDYLREVMEKAETAVEKVIVQLKEQLEEKTDGKLKILAENKVNLEKAATRSLREHILRGGKEN